MLFLCNRRWVSVPPRVSQRIICSILLFIGCAHLMSHEGRKEFSYSCVYLFLWLGLPWKKRTILAIMYAILISNYRRVLSASCSGASKMSAFNSCGFTFKLVNVAQVCKGYGFDIFPLLKFYLHKLELFRECKCV